jgi:ABC-type transport system substrate-binding protein
MPREIPYLYSPVDRYFRPVSTATVTTGGGVTTVTTSTTGTVTGTVTSTVTTGSHSTTAAATTPSFVSSSSLVYETAGNFQWLDPSVSYYQADYGIFQNVFEKLIWFSGDNSSNLIPWLTTDLGTQSNNGHTWVFHLRQGIKFADGTPFNATSVWFSFTRLLIFDGTAGDQSVHGSQAAWIIQQLLNTSLASGGSFGTTQTYDHHWVNEVLAENFVQIIDPYTVQFNLVHPSASFLYLISNEWADIMSPSWVVAHDDASLLKSHMTTADYLPYWQEFAGLAKLTSMILPTTAVMAGTGPYYLKSADGVTYNVVLQANPNYWGGPAGFKVNGQQITIGKPRIQTIYWDYVADINTQLLDLKAGKATMVDGSASLLYSYVDQNTWLQQGKLKSIIPGATEYGTFPTLITDWFEFGSNITNADGSYRSFQPFADWRLREAVQVSVNMTNLLITVANRLDAPANVLVPPGTNPAGTYTSTIGTPKYNLTYAEQLLKAVAATPLKSSSGTLHFYNGTLIKAGVVDNSFTTSNPKNIILTYVAGGTVGQNIINTIATNLNKISIKDKLGLTFLTQPLPSGNRYTQMAEHHIDFAPAGWVADYNWVTDWLGPMFSATGTYYSWSLWNNTALNTLVNNAFAADTAGNTAQLVSLSLQAQALENQAGYYMWEAYPVVYNPASTWLTGFYYNIAIGDSGFYFPTYGYAAPS